MPNNNKPGLFNTGRIVVWGLFALVMAVAPLVFTSGLGMTVLSQMGIAIIACLSYNMLLGQGGMLSFGHAVYTGLGAFGAIHALNAISGGSLPMPVSLVPIVGGFFGMGFAVLFGYVTTRMDRRDRAACRVGQQHWQAIRHAHGTYDAWHHTGTGIGFDRPGRNR